MDGYLSFIGHGIDNNKYLQNHDMIQVVWNINLYDPSCDLIQRKTPVTLLNNRDLL